MRICSQKAHGSKQGTLLADLWKQSVCVFQCINTNRLWVVNNKEPGGVMGFCQDYENGLLHTQMIFFLILYLAIWFSSHKTQPGLKGFVSAVSENGVVGDLQLCVRLSTWCFNTIQLLASEARPTHAGVSKVTAVRYLRGNCVGRWLWRCIHIKCLES